MSRSIETSDATYERLKNLMGSPDTFESVIVRLLDAYEQENERNIVSHANAPQPSPIRKFFGADVPNLTHTRILGASIDGEGWYSPKWNSLKNHLIKLSLKNNVDVKILGISGIFLGEKTNEGYKYLPELGISVQGQSADDAWRSIVTLSRALNIIVKITVEWRNKETATFPGQTAELYSKREIL